MFHVTHDIVYSYTGFHTRSNAIFVRNYVCRLKENSMEIERSRGLISSDCDCKQNCLIFRANPAESYRFQSGGDNKMSARVFDALITFPYVVESEAAKRFSAKICFNLFHALDSLLLLFFFLFLFKRFKRIACLNKFQAVGINCTFFLEKAIVLPLFVLFYGVSCGRRRPSFVRSS